MPSKSTEINFEWLLFYNIYSFYKLKDFFNVTIVSSFQYLFFITNCNRFSVADPGFSPGGGANSQKCYYFSIFCRKLHENERIWTPRGGARPWRPPLDPPMVLSNWWKPLKFFWYQFETQWLLLLFPWFLKTGYFDLPMVLHLLHLNWQLFQQI